MRRREGTSEVAPLPITKISFEAEVGGVTVTVQLSGDAERMHVVQDEISRTLHITNLCFEESDNPNYGCDRCDPDGTIRNGVAVETPKNGHDNGVIGTAFGSSFDNV